MTERERLLEKLMKVKALADRGEGGERESAERTLAALMERYGITEADLEDNQVSTHWIRYKTVWEKKLLHQLAYMYLGWNLHRAQPKEGRDQMHSGAVHRD